MSKRDAASSNEGKRKRGKTKENKENDSSDPPEDKPSAAQSEVVSNNKKYSCVVVEHTGSCYGIDAMPSTHLEVIGEIKFDVPGTTKKFKLEVYVDEEGMYNESYNVNAMALALKSSGKYTGTAPWPLLGPIMMIDPSAEKVIPHFVIEATQKIVARGLESTLEEVKALQFRTFLDNGKIEKK